MKKQFFRVKQLADQTFLRAEKSKILNDDELQIADHKVEYLRAALSAINKKLPPSGMNIDTDKRAKKCMEYQLGSIFLEQCCRKKENEIFDGYSECRLFQDILKEAGAIEQQLAKEYAEHEVKVEDLISIPINKLIETEFPSIMKHKRNLAKYSLDKDSTNSRYQATKKEALKDELEEADVKVEQCRDALAIEMFNLLAKENEFASYILQLLKLQRGYHESALNNLQTIIPQLEKKIGHSSVKRVFGIPLEEHLAVTGKHIAYPLEICIVALTELGMYEEGLFRLTGSMSKVKRLKAAIDSGCFCEIIPEYRDVHVIASILKLYLRELPEPLLTFKLYKEWMGVVNQPENQRLEYVRNVLKKLPKENYENLTYLIQFLAKLSHNTVNKMSSSNIAIVMSPNLLWGQNDDANLNMGNCATTNILVELFIKEVDELFKENVTQLVTPLNLFVDEEKMMKIENEHQNNELHASSESIQQITDSPRPNTRKKKAAPVPPSKTDDLSLIERASLTSSYPSGSSTLTRKPKESKVKTSVGTNTENSLTRRTSFNEDTKKNLKNGLDFLLVNNIEQQQQDNKKFKTTVTHTIVVNPEVKPVAAPRTINETNVVRTPSIRASEEIVQLRRFDNVKPEIPARPASLQQKRSSFELSSDPSTPHKTQCSVYSVANKQQPSFVNIHSKNEKFLLGHDNQMAEKEKFLGHNTSEKVTPLPRTKFMETDKFLEHEKQKPPISEKPNLLHQDDSEKLPSERVSRPISFEKPGLPPKFTKSTKSNEKLNIAVKSNEKLDLISNNGEIQRKSSHNRTRSDGNIIDLKENLPLSPASPSSPRSLNKPTQPPPPPPVQQQNRKSEGDSTDL